MSAYEIEPAVAGSDHGWLVAWASTRSVLPGDVGLPHKQGEIGHASVSPHGFVQSLHVPELPVRNIRWKRRPAIAWTGRDYLLVWDDESTIFGAGISANGVRIDREDIPISDGFAPALAGKSGGAVLAYSVVQPERGIGAAPQAYQREVAGGLPRRRVAGRR